MARTISIFNNKGGVGKTTYMFHVAHLLASTSLTVLMVDCDGQANLTAHTLRNAAIRKSWSPDGNSIWKNIEQVAKGVGDVGQRSPIQFNPRYPTLYIVPGDLRLTDFEDRLGDTWSAAKGGSEAAVRVQSAIHRYIKWAANKIKADVVLVDLGPSLGAINRAVLASSDYFIIPMAPDLFSIEGTRNLGEKLVLWHREWAQCHQAWNGNDVELPDGTPKFLGYVIQSHNIRNNSEKMTRGWNMFGRIIEQNVQSNIVDKLTTIDQVVDWADGSYNLGMIPNLHSLIPYSQAARKPVFDCSYGDGLQGAHVTRAAESRDHFSGIVDIIRQTLVW
ncbi:ParA family protein [Azospirillum sp. B4]|uniref:ParA family protein n=1 Tax=Azospirillum sp. B4 TaxID=95605 RepID=UPI00034495A2|nr:ParA family protein [Azospirillum sp. B4]